MEPLCSREIVGKFLLRLCTTHRRELSKIMLDTYHEGLADLSDREVELGFQEVIKRLQFWPQVADVRNALAIALERMPRPDRTAPDCKECDGNGYVVIEREGRRVAQLCACRSQREVLVEEENAAKRTG